jgi:platelet-activating factor acetylhydrolase IB subunit alpha
MVLEGHDNWVRDLAFHPCGLLLLSASDDRSVRIWDLSKARTLKTLSDAHRY